jgi:hypothetical protein
VAFERLSLMKRDKEISTPSQSFTDIAPHAVRPYPVFFLIVLSNSILYFSILFMIKGIVSRHFPFIDIGLPYYREASHRCIYPNPGDMTYP